MGKHKRKEDTAAAVGHDDEGEEEEVKAVEQEEVKIKKEKKDKSKKEKKKAKKEHVENGHAASDADDDEDNKEAKKVKKEKKEKKKKEKKQEEEVEEENDVESESAAAALKRDGPLPSQSRSFSQFENNGEDGDEDDETSEEEDEEGELITNEVKDGFVQVLSLIKKKDPRIYEKDKKIFDDDIIERAEQQRMKKLEAKSSEKPVYLKDQLRDTLMTMGAEGAARADAQLTTASTRFKTYQEEQDEIRDEFTKAAEELHAEVDEIVNADEDGFFSVKSRAPQPPAAGDELLSRYFDDAEQLDEEEKFLRSYVLGEGWKEGSKIKPPGLRPEDEEMIEQSRLESGANRMALGKQRELFLHPDPDADEEALEKQDEFEEKYNFRYEQPEGVQIITHARNVEDSVRRKDEKRKKKREERAKRKEAEKEQKKKELVHAKNEKKRQILSRIKSLASLTGAQSFVTIVCCAALKDLLETEFDSTAFTEKLADLIGEQGLGEDIEKALEEVFNLDFEDIIGDQPVRFKYRQVQPLDYGLSTREVLALEDRQLNEILPLKYLAPLRRQYRSDQRVPRPKMKKLELYRQELRNKKQMRERAQETMEDLKWQKQSGATGDMEAEELAGAFKKKHKSKSKKRSLEEAQEEGEEGKAAEETQQHRQRHHHKKEEKEEATQDGEEGTAADAGEAGEPPKKRRKRHRKLSAKKQREKQAQELGISTDRRELYYQLVTGFGKT